MWWLYVILGFILLLVVVYFAIVIHLYKKTFTNTKVERQGIVINENSPYYAFKDHIVKYKQMFLDFNKEEVSVVSNDNLTLRGYFVENKIKDKVVIIFHGFKSKASGDFSLSYDYYKLGYSLLIVDQRAHGTSEGKYIGMGILERYDVLKWIDFVLDKCGENTSILLSGTSMGASTVMMASELIKKSQVKGIVADCGFSSCFEEIRHCLKKVPYFPVMPTINLCSKIFAKYDMKKITAEKSLANSKIPLLVIHGENDDFVPSYHSKRCYGASISEIKDCLFIEGAYHASSFVLATELYDQKVRSFLEKINF
jgi:fermentation-respiration switch protein FrsA (DUF1100 family)